MLFSLQDFLHLPASEFPRVGAEMPPDGPKLLLMAPTLKRPVPKISLLARQSSVPKLLFPYAHRGIPPALPIKSGVSRLNKPAIAQMWYDCEPS